MTTDRYDHSVTADAPADPDDQLQQLDEHIDQAAKKVQDRRPVGDPPDGDVLDDIAGAGTDDEQHVDDPEGSPIIGPE
jgi:hypothetical protein